MFSPECRIYLSSGNNLAGRRGSPTRHSRPDIRGRSCTWGRREHNKLERFFPGKPLLTDIMIEGKAKSLHLKGLEYGLTHKYWNRQKKTYEGQNTSLFFPLISDEESFTLETTGINALKFSNDHH